MSTEFDAKLARLARRVALFVLHHWTTLSQRSGDRLPKHSLPVWGFGGRVESNLVGSVVCQKAIEVE